MANLSKMNRDIKRDEAARGGGTGDRLPVRNLNVKGQRLLVYICPDQEHMDGLPWIRWMSHRPKWPAKGPKAICLECEGNVEILEREDVSEILAKRENFDLTVGSCPIEEMAEIPGLLPEMEIVPQYLLVGIPWATLEVRGDATTEVPLPENERVPSWIFASPQVAEGIAECYRDDNTLDSPDGGALVQIICTGKAPNYYICKLYNGKAKGGTPHPFVVPKPQRFLMNKLLGPGNPGDPYAFFARFVKDNQAVRDLYGQKATTEKAADDGDDRPACFAESTVFDKNDDDCKACPSMKDCAAALNIDLKPAPAKAKPASRAKPAKAKPAPAPEPEPEEPEEEVPDAEETSGAESGDDFDAELSKYLE